AEKRSNPLSAMYRERWCGVQEEACSSSKSRRPTCWLAEIPNDDVEPAGNSSRVTADVVYATWLSASISSSAAPFAYAWCASGLSRNESGVGPGFCTSKSQPPA